MRSYLRAMRRALYPLLLALVVAATAGLPARAQEPPDGVKVRGEGVVATAPDIATVTLGATVREATPAAAFTRAEELSNQLFANLIENGIEPRDVQTTRVTLNQESMLLPPETPQGQPRQVVTWRASNVFTVKVRDLGRVAEIIEDAVAVLGREATVQGISYGVEDTDALISRARAEAFRNAREAAEELARLAGRRLGEVVSIEETFTPSPTPVQADAPTPMATPRPAPSPVAMRPDAALGQIAPGQISVRVFVVIVFALERPSD